MSDAKTNTRYANAFRALGKVTVADLARITGMKQSTITGYQTRGYIPDYTGVNSGGLKYWAADVLVDWLPKRPGQGARSPGDPLWK